MLRFIASPFCPKPHQKWALLGERSQKVFPFNLTNALFWIEIISLFTLLIRLFALRRVGRKRTRAAQATFALIRRRMSFMKPLEATKGGVCC